MMLACPLHDPPVEHAPTLLCDGIPRRPGRQVIGNPAGPVTIPCLCTECGCGEPVQPDETLCMACADGDHAP